MTFVPKPSVMFLSKVSIGSGLPKWSIKMDDLCSLTIYNVHIKASFRSTAHPCTTVSVLLGEINFLSHGVQYFVLVGSLKSWRKSYMYLISNLKDFCRFKMIFTSKCFKHLHLLLDNELIYHG